MIPHRGERESLFERSDIQKQCYCTFLRFFATVVALVAFPVSDENQIIVEIGPKFEFEREK
jgi:hypothetical protein